VLSGPLWHGTPHALLDRVREGTLIFISSPALLAELAESVSNSCLALSSASSCRCSILSSLKPAAKSDYRGSGEALSSRAGS
jgi:hypothetical protein